MKNLLLLINISLILGSCKYKSSEKTDIQQQMVRLDTLSVSGPETKADSVPIAKKEHHATGYSDRQDTNTPKGAPAQTSQSREKGVIHPPKGSKPVDEEQMNQKRKRDKQLNEKGGAENSKDGNIDDQPHQ